MGREGGLFVDFLFVAWGFFLIVEECFAVRKCNRLKITTDTSGIKERCILYDC